LRHDVARKFLKNFLTFIGTTNVAKVEDTAGPRHQGRSCSRLPQRLDNAGDAVSSAFLKGKQHSKKSCFHWMPATVRPYDGYSNQRKAFVKAV